MLDIYWFPNSEYFPKNMNLLKFEKCQIYCISFFVFHVLFYFDFNFFSEALYTLPTSITLTCTLHPHPTALMLTCTLQSHHCSHTCLHPPLSLLHSPHRLCVATDADTFNTTLSLCDMTLQYQLYIYCHCYLSLRHLNAWEVTQKDCVI